MKTSAEAVMISVRAFRLHEFDWDGTGGLPMRSDVADTVADIYDLPFMDELPLPMVALCSDGTVSVEYDEEEGTDVGKKLFLTFKCQGVITYVKMFSDGDTMVEGTLRLDGFERTDGAFNPDDFAALIELCDWLAGE